MARITLDAFRADDAAPMVAALSQAETARWLSSVPQPYGPDQARAFIANHRPDEFAIRVDGVFAGTVRGGESLGYWVAPEFRRQGIARRAAVLALSRSFAEGRDAVSADCHPQNLPSLALLKALDFGDAETARIRSLALAQDLPALRVTLSRATFIARHGMAIRTPRLLLDQVCPHDLPPLYHITTRPEVARMLKRFYPDMPLRDFVAIFPAQSALPPTRLAIRRHGATIGMIGIGEPDAEDGAAIFYSLSPECWGHGYGAEALAGFLQEIDDRFAPRHLRAEVFADNPASARLLEAAGFQRIGPCMLQSAGRPQEAPGWLFRRSRA